MNYKTGQFIVTKNYGLGQILSGSETDNYYSFTVDFNIGDRSINILKDSSNESLFRPATDEEVSMHLKYRVYKRGEDRYLTNEELDKLKVGDLILHQRKGFGTIESIKQESGNTFFILSFGEQSSSMDKNKAKLVRFSLTHENSNEFWEPVDLSVKKDVSQSEIVNIEEYTKRKLPRAYVDFLQNYPTELVFFNRQRTTEKLNEINLPNSVSGIINLFEQFESFDLSFLTPIGTDGLGNFYVLRENLQDVYLIEHEGYFDKKDNSITLNLKNFEKYAEQVANNINELATRIVMDAIERSSKIFNNN